MTRETFGNAYTNGHQQTIHFLLSKGPPEDLALETAQAAWARGWDRRAQIRDTSKTFTLEGIPDRTQAESGGDRYSSRAVLLFSVVHAAAFRMNRRPILAR